MPTRRENAVKKITLAGLIRILSFFLSPFFLKRGSPNCVSSLPVEVPLGWFVVVVVFKYIYIALLCFARTTLPPAFLPSSSLSLGTGSR